MAATTISYAVNMAKVPLSIEKGVQQLAFHFNSGATAFGTTSDVVLLGKVPNGALITDKNLRIGAQGNANFSVLLLAVEANGTYSTYASLFAAAVTASQTAAQVFSDVQPVKVSLSDDRAIQYTVLALNCTSGASATASFSLQGFIQYVADGSTV